MHLKSVGLAICIGMAMVKPSLGQQVTTDNGWGVETSKGMADVVFVDPFDDGSGSASGPVDKSSGSASTKRRAPKSRHAQGRLKRRSLINRAEQTK